MTYGQLFMRMNPNVKVVENGTCVWIFFDEVNHDTMRKGWWDKEIPDDANDAGWISVKDRLPEEKQSEITFDFEYVLCATTFGDVRPYKFGKPIGWKEPHFWHGSGLMDKYVTHWMPLPEPPKEG